MNQRVRYMSTVVGGLLLLCGACSRKSIPHPTTKEEFAVAYKKAFEEGDRETIAQWVKWGDVPRELRARYLDLHTTFAGQNKVVLIKVDAYDEAFVKPEVEQGQKVHFSLKPVYWYRIETFGKAGNDGGKSETWLEGALGYEDGKLYLCGPIMDFTEWRKLPPKAE